MIILTHCLKRYYKKKENSMSNQNIVNDINTTITSFCKDFKVSPYLFFTENDIVCRLHCKLQEKLKKDQVPDLTGKMHSLVHTEYATPFRCDMKGSSFEIKGDHDKTPNGRLHKRGHYDIAILNPDFIKSNSFEIIQGQNYSKVRQFLNIKPSYPMILYGIEIMYSRTALKSSRGSNKFKGIENYCDKIDQDMDKLEASVKHRYMEKCRMLVFFQNWTGFMSNYLRKKYKNTNCSLCVNP